VPTTIPIRAARIMATMMTVIIVVIIRQRIPDQPSRSDSRHCQTRIHRLLRTAIRIIRRRATHTRNSKRGTGNQNRQAEPPRAGRCILHAP
jgi:hypothetical protein